MASKRVKREEHIHEPLLVCDEQPPYVYSIVYTCPHGVPPGFLELIVAICRASTDKNFLRRAEEGHQLSYIDPWRLSPHAFSNVLSGQYLNDMDTQLHGISTSKSGSTLNFILLFRSVCLHRRKNKWAFRNTHYMKDTGDTLFYFGRSLSPREFCSGNTDRDKHIRSVLSVLFPKDLVPSILDYIGHSLLDGVENVEIAMRGKCKCGKFGDRRLIQVVF